MCSGLTFLNRGEVSLKLDIRRIFGHSFPMENYFLLNSFRVIGPRGPRPMLTSPTKWYEAIEQKAVFHRKLMGFLKYLNKIGGAKY